MQIYLVLFYTTSNSKSSVFCVYDFLQYKLELVNTGKLVRKNKNAMEEVNLELNKYFMHKMLLILLRPVPSNTLKMLFYLKSLFYLI